MKTIYSITFLFLTYISFSQENTSSELIGNPEAIEYAKQMVDAMGGTELWAKIKTLKFKHKWYPINRGSFIEDEIIDLTAPRSWVRMKSEDFERIRAYSPEHKYWSVMNGKFSSSEESYQNAVKRAPFNIYRLAHAIANNNFPYKIELGKTDIPTGIKLEFMDDDGNVEGSIVLNARKEPLAWQPPQFKYTFGPMKQFGDLRVPNWAVYDQGSFRYEMISLLGDNQPVDLSIFEIPEKFKS